MTRIALIVPTRNDALYVKKTYGLLKDLTKQWKQSIESVESLSGENLYDVQSLINSMTGSRGWYVLSYEGLDSLQRDLPSIEFSARQRTELDNIHEWRKYYLEALQRCLTRFSPVAELAGKLRGFRAEAEDEYPWDEEYQEGIHPKVASKIEALTRLIQMAHKKLALQIARAEARQTQQIQPEARETLYHASAVAADLRRGFSATVPAEDLGMGLGGSQVDKAGNRAISFTYDLRAALQIARAYKELAQVYKGQVKARHILDWVAREKNGDAFLKFLQMSWTSYTISFEFGQGGPRLWELDPAAQKKKFLDPDQVFATPRDRVKLYKAYISTSKTRFNPFFMHIQRTAEFLARNEKKIGVISAEVDMSHPDLAYLPSEREFRVPPSAVLQVKKFIR